ncbi:MAG TPA: GNAT family protein [Rhodocyclaceae bacterium]|nr:GNAT family protein [Rhodocyclaceae bacterium]
MGKPPFALALNNQWIELRAPVAADIPALLRATRASRHLHSPWVKAPATAQALEAWLERSAYDDYQSLLAIRRNDRSLVGVFNFSQIVRGLFCNAYLGYYALAPNAGRGYMRTALPLVLNAGFGRLALHRIEANIQPDNLASRTLLQSAGFRLEGFSPKYLKIGGRWCDHERWAILNEEWMRHRRQHVIPTPD